MANTQEIMQYACIAHNNTALVGSTKTIQAGVNIGKYGFYKNGKQYNIELDSSDEFTNTYFKLLEDSREAQAFCDVYAKVDIPLEQAVNKPFKIKFSDAGTDVNVVELYLWKNTVNPELWLQPIKPTVTTEGNELAYIQCDTVSANLSLSNAEYFTFNKRGSANIQNDRSAMVLAVLKAFEGKKPCTVRAADLSATTGTITYTFGYEAPEIKQRMTKANMCYEITKEWDLNGETLTVPTGCTLNFTHLGKVNNGKIKLQGTALVLPANNIANIGTATIDSTSTYATGQMLYDTTLKKPKWYNGTAWITADGTAIE